MPPAAPLPRARTRFGWCHHRTITRGSFYLQQFPFPHSSRDKTTSRIKIRIHFDRPHSAHSRIQGDSPSSVYYCAVYQGCLKVEPHVLKDSTSNDSSLKLLASSFHTCEREPSPNRQPMPNITKLSPSRIHHSTLIYTITLCARLRHSRDETERSESIGAFRS